MNVDEHSVRASRRDAVAKSAEWIGLDYVAVLGSESIPERDNRLWSLALHFIPSSDPLKPALPTQPLEARNLRFTVGSQIESNVRVREIREPRGEDAGAGPGTERILVSIETEEPQRDESWVVVLHLVDVPGVDRFFASVPVRLLAVGEEAMVVPLATPKAPQRHQPVLDFMAKDFESFRRLMLERMTFEVPRWKERSIADPGVTTVEVLAYAADYLSYFQDAVATEAYIDTARRRESVRRHGRLIDYVLHEGSNARVWVQVQIGRRNDRGDAASDRYRPVRGSETPAVEAHRQGDQPQDTDGAAQDGEIRDGNELVGFRLPAGTPLLTYCPRAPGVLIEGRVEEERARTQKPLEFQTMISVDLFPDHNQIDIYAWGAGDYALPVGATSATLVGRLPSLEAGDVLVFECCRDPMGGDNGTPDVRARQAVRLVSARCDRDPLTGIELTEVQWFAGDSLEVALPVSRVVDNVPHTRLTVARGNMVLADHGATQHQELSQVSAHRHYRPGLGRVPLTYREPIDADALRQQPAARALEQKPWDALPEITLVENAGDHSSGDEPMSVSWRPRVDLLRSDLFDRHFIVETGDDRRVWLRFGNGENGHRPTPGTNFRAIYRQGKGPDGNVGVGALRHVVLTDSFEKRVAAWGFRVEAASNFLPGVGGTPAETTEHARITAPELVQRHGSENRCIIAEDYAELARRNPDVADAVAELRFAGAGQTAVVYVERTLDRRIDDELLARLRSELDASRMVGTEVEVRGPKDVALDVMLTLRLGSSQSMTHLERAMQRSGGVLRLFEPGELTFGRSVYLSELIARAMALPGIADVDADVFRRWGESGRGALDTGVIPIGRFEIARLDGNETRPQRGILRVRIERISADGGANQVPVVRHPSWQAERADGRHGEPS